MANTSAILQQVTPTNYYLQAAQQEPYKKVKPKSFFFKSKYCRIFWTKNLKSQEHGPLEEQERGLERGIKVQP